jgi:uncharacterized protein (DUF2267 family)
MGDTGFSLFNSTVLKTNKILKEIEQAYGWPKERRNMSYAALRGVLHALRDRLLVQESAHFAAQLPMLVRGIYYHSWDPSQVPVKMHREEFLDRVQKEFPFEAVGGVERLVHTVLHALRRYVAEGEWEIIQANMPKDIASLLQTGPEPSEQPTA